MSARDAYAIALCALAGCATHALEDVARSAHAQPVEPYGMAEECERLAVGDRLEYLWSTDAPVDFDIHYHDSGAVVEPITRKAAKSEGGVFVPVLAEDYCLMWEAGVAGAHLDYRMRVIRARR